MDLEPKIELHLSTIPTEVLVKFTDNYGKQHEAKIKREAINPKDPNDWTVSVNGKSITNGKGSEEFLLCELDQQNGDVQKNGNKYLSHVVMTASDGAFLLVNHSCLYFLNPPGIWINL